MSSTTVTFNPNIKGNVLTQQQKVDYERDGFIVIRGILPQYEIERYRKRFRQICSGEVTIDQLMIMKDVTNAKAEVHGETVVNKIQDFNNDPVLFEYCKYPPIVDVVQDLIGTGKSTLISMHTMLINKPPDTGSLSSRHPMHQDQYYFPFTNPSNICCAWTSLEKVDRNNGCLVVVPGSHKKPLLKHEYPKWEGGVNKAYHGIQEYDPNDPRTYVIMEPGDTVFFHPHLIHGSGANKTTGFRKAISCHYANDDVCRYFDVKGTIQEPIADEIIEMAKKRFARHGFTNTDELNLTFEDIWRYRAREVCGNRSHL
uniref:Phytanoyl-CoA dioxygenase, peroxisomal n=1 Tax=Rhabditophanes sp. KR3021 TaxID=114890 RepID=A0AC35TUA8_9BILA